MRLDREKPETNLFPDNYPEPRKKHSCLKFFLGLTLSSAVILAAIFFTIRFIIGPVIKQVNELPGDFPEELAIYQLEQAKIQIQTDEGRKKILALAEALPDWLVKPLLNYLANDLKTKLGQTFNETRIPNDFTAEDLQKALDNADLKQIKTVSLSWDGIGQSKERIAAYYQEKLKAADFQIKENLADYEINLGFAKENIFGRISFKDAETASSQVRMIINYLAK